MFVAHICASTQVASWAQPILSFVVWTRHTPGPHVGRAWVTFVVWTRLNIHERSSVKSVYESFQIDDIKYININK